MQSQTGNPGTGEVAPVAATRERDNEYRRLLAILASRAQRFGSRDPEAAAQETFKRSWENVTSQPALAFYFGQNLPICADTPQWSLDQLLAWLHAVLRYVVWEERSRAGFRLEVSLDEKSQAGNGESIPEPAHHGPDQLQLIIRQERELMLSRCFPKLDALYQSVLRMRSAGMRYQEIASRLGVNENTVATWVSRGIRDLARCVQKRMYRSFEED
ncbi:MAG TPA: sigma factor-like helix-turn-helix DNA-binding protein [Terriglobales bacterium]|nr:sigma factor-like helix-turn-helix DNA-binding protein [Terriglobales bacterium]